MSNELKKWTRKTRQRIDSLAWAATQRLVDALRYQPAPAGLLLAGPPATLGSVIDRATTVLGREVLPEWLRAGRLVPQPRGIAVLVVDMRGFSNLTNQLDDAGYLTTLIDEYLTEMTRVVEHHHGVVFQYTGDGLLALFVPELTGEEPAELLERLSHRTARELHRRFEKLRARWSDDWRHQGRHGADIGLGVGISYGRAAIGLVGPERKRHFGVIGPPVNMAAYLCSQAKAGTTLVDVATYERAESKAPAAKRVRLKSPKLHQRVEAVSL